VLKTGLAVRDFAIFHHQLSRVEKLEKVGAGAVLGFRPQPILV
jgi:hypothetical protein